MLAVIVYHKNISHIYEPEWINMFRESILNQTRKDFIIYELNYGGNNERLFERSIYESIEMPNFVHAMNYLIDKAFANWATAVFNTNCDDIYSIHRISKQAPLFEEGYDIVSSNFSLMRDGEVFHAHKFEHVDIETELMRGHNVICHPVVAMSKAFWECNRYDPSQIPTEDLQLWQRAIKNSKFIILPEVLLHQRIHNNSVCKSTNR